MRHFLTVRVLLVGILLGVLGIPGASAADPYFAPYGAHRGRIHIGRHHARIRWGGGVTPYGAAVLMHGFDVAGSVGRAYFGAGDDGGGGSGSGDDSASMGSESAAESNEAECQEQLRKTQELLEETKKACGVRGGPEASAEPGAEPTAASSNPYARVEAVKRQVAQTLPLIEELQQSVARQKKAAEDFEQVLARDRQVFEAFVQSYQNP